MWWQTHRSILHIDMNCFYASVEMAEHPELRGQPVIVGGDEEARHGIVLTASYPAKHCGVKTAMTLWEARRLCPQAIIVPPHYELYLQYAHHARSLYNEYTNLVEPFGLDEAWLDITYGVQSHNENPHSIARAIATRLTRELGITTSVGISWNKVFAKFGSDYRKPDAITVVSPDDVASIVWPSPVRNLIYVGRATERKLRRMGIATIGQLAHADEYAIRRTLGKMGQVVQAFAQGHDSSPVRCFDPHANDILHEIKGVGNGITTPFDIDDEQTARQVIWLMGESVAQRLRALGLEARTVLAYGRDFQTLIMRSRQTTLARPTQLTAEICTTAAALLCADWDFAHGDKIRSLGVRATNLSSCTTRTQLDLFGDEQRRQKRLEVDNTIDELRHRFGNHAVRRLSELSNPKLASLDPQRDNVIHPVSFFA